MPYFKVHLRYPNVVTEKMISSREDHLNYVTYQDHGQRRH